MNRERTFLFAAAVAMQPAVGWAYSPSTHEELAEAALIVSDVAVDSRVLADLGLRPYSASQAFPDGTGRVRTIAGLLRSGAFFEDQLSTTRGLNHFLNPLSNAPLSVPFGALGTRTSADWALEDASPVGEQDYSYRDARDYLYAALTRVDQGERRRKFGLMFQTLGMVVHHLQDMAQPQHVRNDMHCDALWWPLFCFGFYNPSRYEIFTDALRASLPYGGYAPVYSSSNTVGWTKPRDFWMNAGKGIAEYTHRGFVSAATNFSGSSAGIASHPEFPEPAAARATVIRKQITELLGPAGPTQPLIGEMHFVSVPVEDRLAGVVDSRPLTSTYSIFDADLRYRAGSWAFTLNRFNYADQQRLLIPRAVGYSAGLINYFFRGRMQVSLPDENVYAIVDHGVREGNATDAGGFREVRFKLKNVTPGDEAMGAPGATWTLRAVAKFRRNDCYTPILSGEYGSPDIGGTPAACRGRTDEIVVSDPCDARDGISRSQANRVTCTFATPIPINATDLALQVVYRGPLGNEEDAVVAATVDVYEPTYLAFFNNYDQYDYTIWYRTEMLHRTWETFCSDQGYSDEACRARYAVSASMSFVSPSAASSAPLVRVENLPVGSFSRIAYLTDAPQQTLYLHDLTTGEDSAFTLQTTTNQLDPATGTITARPYRRFREAYVDEVAYRALTENSAYWSPLRQTPPYQIRALSICGGEAGC